MPGEATPASAAPTRLIPAAETDQRHQAFARHRPRFDDRVMAEVGHFLDDIVVDLGSGVDLTNDEALWRELLAANDSSRAS